MRTGIKLLRSLVAALALGLASGAVLSASCQSNQDGFWDQSTTWTSCGGGVPGSGDTATINGGHQITLRVNASVNTLTFSAAGGSASLSHNSGISLTVGGGGVTINASTTTDSTKSWNIDAGGAAVGSSTVSGPVTLNQGSADNGRIARLRITSGTLTMSGALTFTADDPARVVIDMNNSPASGRINLAGAFNVNNTTRQGTLVMGSGTAVFNFNGISAAQTVPIGLSSVVYQNLHTNNITPAGATLGSNAITTARVTGNVRVQSGTLNNAGFAIDGGAAATFEVANGARFNLTGTSAFPTNFGTVSLGATSTTSYQGAAQTVRSGITYGHLNIAGTAGTTKAPETGSFTVAGNFTVAATGIFNGSIAGTDPNIFIKGNLTNSGSFTSGLGTYTFNGAVAQTLSGVTAFDDLAMANTAAAASQKLTISNDVTISTSLTFTSGRIVTGANKVIMSSGATVSGAAAATGWVAGRLQKSVASGSPSVAFEVGTDGAAAPAIGYSPVTLAFVGVGSTGNLIASATIGDHAQIASSDLDSSKSVNRWWLLTTTGVTGTALGAFTSFSPTFTFLTADLDSGVVTSSLETDRWNGSAWSTTTPGTRTSNSTQATGVTALGEFAVAQKAAPVVPTPGSFDAFETSQADTASPKVIKTKVSGTGFTLSVMAIQSGAKLAGFSANVKVELIGTNTLGSLTAGNCPTSGATVLQTIASTAIASGRSNVTFAAVADSWRDVRVRVSYPTSSPTVTSCSSDNFAIRPSTFASFSVTDNDAQTAGTNRTLNVTTVPGGGVLHKAGQFFTIRATAVNAAGSPATTANYTLAPTATLTSCGSGAGFEACTATFGNLTPIPNFAAGVLSTSTASYDNVGAFALQLVDSTFASVDASDGSTTAERNITSSIINVGRFIPDHFAVSLNSSPTTPSFTPGCTGFTYVGQAFNYAVQPQITVTAQGAANNTATLYTGTLWQITNSTLTYPAGTSRGYKWLSGTLDVSNVPVTDPLIAIGSGANAGTGTLTFSSGAGLTFTRTTPVTPFNAEISLAINVIDGDGISYSGNPAKFGNETAGNGIFFTDGNAATTNDKLLRFGRLVAGSRNGSPAQPLTLPLETQYWTGTTFATNTLDSCTTVAAGNLGLGNYAGRLVSGDTTPSIPGGAFSAGKKSITLTAPVGGHTGSVDMVVNLGTSTAINSCLAWATTPTPAGANLAHLRGQWCGSGYTRDPTARATFGLNVGGEEVIYFKENF